MGEIARHDFTIVREGSVMFEVIARMRRRRASTALVFAAGRPSAATLRGVIDREQIADAVARSVRIYPG
jgi:CIC family chloride channel protein